jgi:hypothetical protein
MASEKTAPEGGTPPLPSSPQRLADDGDAAETITGTDTAENDIEVLEGFDETITEE